AVTSTHSNPSTLSYLLRFLDAYDFASEGDEQVQETHKPLISAAVLGLIFEKLNGYQDGSFYTPGFITMYMARHTLRRAVVQHFERRYGLGAPDVPALADALDPKNRVADSAYFNTLTVLDPAVGSGHFLVSALNELLAIKAELGLLLDDTGKRLRYRLTVARDELVVMHEDDDPHDPAALFQYRAHLAATGQRTVSAKHTALQRALFQEKRHLIEHALFGVDINPNSVRICRLRLWIELLKHAYYLPETGFAQLETLPNLELNIKAGNSLLSRFDLAADLSDVFRQSKFTLATYRDAVHAYFNTRDRAAKQDLQKFLTQIKEQFTQALHKRDPLREKLRRALGERTMLETQGQLLPETPKQREARTFELRRLTLLIEQYEKEVERHEQGQLYRHAFEWRFEFPEVLDEKGKFRGFDVVIGNPPYIRQEDIKEFKGRFQGRFRTFASTADIYVYFIELGLDLLRQEGELSYITPNKWLRANYGQPLRQLLADRELIEFIDFNDLPVFPEATTYPSILSVRQAEATASFATAVLTTLPTPEEFEQTVAAQLTNTFATRLNEGGWNLASIEQLDLLDKLKAGSVPLNEHAEGKIYYGIKTGLNPAFVVDAKKHQQLIEADPASAEILKPFLAGRDIKRYQRATSNNYLIRLPSGWTRLALGWQRDLNGRWKEPAKPLHTTPWAALEASYPAIAAHLWPFASAAQARADKGFFWWELRSCDYYDDFERPKILFPDIAPTLSFTLDNNGTYLANTAYFLPANNLYLLGVLNSSCIDFFFRSLTATIRGGYLRFFKQYLDQLPIPHATPAQQAEIAALVEQVLAAKAAGEPTAALEAAIDALVAARYGLSPAEVAQLGS
ncbi:MAG TPA: TaqI-like C-terminal specificity domain-containing protein, partial [Hymenobacter sp.]|uniref:Eco57I restriction-modification methylase domain-containing protein n=1 Tax=Hymenobacter sp. TaxID=1898978 RepID=UPI002D7F898F